MPKVWCDFLNAVNKNVKQATIVCSIAFLAMTSVAFADGVEAVLPSLPELELKVVQKNENGNQYQLGDRIRLYVELTPEQLLNQNSFAISPPPGGSKLEDQGWYLDPQPLLISNNLQFVVSPIRAGKITLPTLVISKEDKSGLARTSPFTVEVVALQGKQAPNELLDPLDIGLAAKYWALFVSISLLVLALSVFFIRRYLKNRRQVKPISIPVVKKDPDHVIALNALDQLYKKYPFSNDNLKPVSFGISEILKHFFSDRFHTDAKESTTDEMIVLLRKESIPSDGLREIQSLFNDLDLIKFTKNRDYAHFSEQHYIEFKVKAQSLIQKWAQRSEGPST